MSLGLRGCQVLDTVTSKVAQVIGELETHQGQRYWWVMYADGRGRCASESELIVEPGVRL